MINTVQSIILFIAAIFVTCSTFANTTPNPPTTSRFPVARPDSITLRPSLNADCPPSSPSQNVDSRVCYDESIFNNSRDTPGRRDTLRAYAPIAIYLQEVTGYPASMILSQRIKEQGWRTRAP